MEDYKYDCASVQELLTWAKKVLDDNSLPEGRFVMNQSCTKTDCRFFVESSIVMMESHGDNPTFFPYIKQLYEFRDKLAKTGVK